jgi:hypothetical protein
MLTDEYGRDAEVKWPEPRDDPREEPSHPGARDEDLDEPEREDNR